jgi:hypothetical protein
MDLLQIDAADAVASGNDVKGIHLLQHLAGTTAIRDLIRLKAARALIRHDPDSGLQHLIQISESRETEPEIRIGAAIAVGDHADAAESVRLLLALSSDHYLPGSLRLKAAVAIWRRDEESGISELTSLAANSRINSTVRIDAARQVANSRAHYGLQLLLQLTANLSTAKARITAGQAAGKLDPARGAAALSQLAKERQLDSTTRLTAALAAMDFDISQGLSALTELACSEIHAPVRQRAAEEVAERNPKLGANLLVRLAEDDTENMAFRRNAARALAKYDHLRSVGLLNVLEPPKRKNS